MSYPTITVDSFDSLIELSDRQQEFLVGGADFGLNNSNFGQNLGGKRTVTTSGPQGNSSSTNAFDKKLNNSAQGYSGLSGMIPTGITALPPAVLENVPANMLLGMGIPGSINTTTNQAPTGSVLS
jgi:hypothetical protein